MYKVYWTDKTGQEHSLFSTDLSTALNNSRYAREAGGTFVCMASENPNSVGKSGVDEIKDGKCPDGVAYDWNKASRIGAPKRHR